MRSVGMRIRALERTRLISGYRAVDFGGGAVESVRIARVRRASTAPKPEEI